MKLLDLSLIGAFMLCDVSDEALSELSLSPVISNINENDQSSMEDMIQIHITNQHRVESFKIPPEATTWNLYRLAESIRIIDSFIQSMTPNSDNNEWLVDQGTGRLIRCDRNIQMEDLLTPGVQEIEREINLRVIKSADLWIMVHIINGDRYQMVWAKANWSTRKIYQIALEKGIMNNIHQYNLCRANDPRQTLSAIPNHQTLEQHLNLQCPLELRLNVEQMAEDRLLDWTFRKMSPKPEQLFWTQAYYDHDLYGPKSEINVQFEGWTGKLDLKFLPPTIKSLVLRGRSVEVDFKHLRFTSLKELVLDFESIEGIDWLDLEGSQLEALRVPVGFRRSCAKDLEALRHLRTQGKIKIDAIHFGNLVQIMYHEASCQYLFYV